MEAFGRLNTPLQKILNRGFFAAKRDGVADDEHWRRI
jgi:hypothetical protein